MIPTDEFMIGHGASRFIADTKFADLKRKNKTGRVVFHFGIVHCILIKWTGTSMTSLWTCTVVLCCHIQAYPCNPVKLLKQKTWIQYSCTASVTWQNLLASIIVIWKAQIWHLLGCPPFAVTSPAACDSISSHHVGEPPGQTRLWRGHWWICSSVFHRFVH